jgi:FkbM family methyltransferase
VGSLTFELLMRVARARPGRDRALLAYDLEGNRLLIPAVHELVRYRRYWQGYGENLGTIARHVLAKYPTMSAVDVGANVGDSAVQLRRGAPVPVLCVEGDARFAELLRHNLRGVDDAEIEEAFIGPDRGDVRVERRSAGGTSWLVAAGDAGEDVRFVTLGSLLASHPRFARPALIKIDTDGFDCDIVRAERDLLADLRTVVFFEYSPHMYADRDGAFEVFSVLRAAGYTQILAYLSHGEYLAAASLGDERLLADLHSFATADVPFGQPSLRYLDICAFHAGDEDVADAVRGELLAQPRPDSAGR